MRVNMLSRFVGFPCTDKQLRTRALEQELALAQNNAEWSRNELSRERESAAKSRAELVNRAVQAESSRDVAEKARASSAAQLSQAEQILRETQSRYTDAVHAMAELRGRLATQENDAKMSQSAAEQAIDLAEARVRRAEHRAKELEASCDAIMSECAARERAVRLEADEALAKLDSLEQEKTAVQDALDHLAGALGVDDALSGTMTATPSRAASFAAQVQQDGKKFSDVYVDLLRVQEELRRESEERGRLEGVLAEVMADLDAHAPQLKAQRVEAMQLRADLDSALSELQDARDARMQAEGSAQDLSAELERVRREHVLEAQQLEDATSQVRTLLRETILLKDPSAAERLSEDGIAGAGGDPSQRASSDIQDVITEELVTFRSLSELCAQNQRLLQAVRELGQRLEARDPRDAELRDAADMLERVSEELRSERQALATVERERDLYKNVCTARGLDAHDNGSLHAPEPGPAPSPVPPVPPTVLADLSREAAARAAAEERIHMLQEAVKFHESRLADAMAHTERVQAVLDRRDAALRDMEQALAASRATEHDYHTRLAARDAELRLVLEQRDGLLQENTRLGEARAEAEAAARSAYSAGVTHSSEHAAHVERLQRELATLQVAATTHETRLAEARAEATHASLRRDIETRELRERLETLAQQHAAAREALATAQSDAQHQERRAADVSQQLEHARQMASLLEKQHAAAEESRRAAVAKALGGASDSQLPPERQLEMELSDVRRGRAAAEADTLAAKAALAEAQSAQARTAAELEQLKQELTNAQAAKQAAMAEKDKLSAEWQARLDDVEGKLKDAASRSEELERQLHEQAAAHTTEKRELEDAMAGLHDAETNAATEQVSAWDEVRRFSAQAKEASLRADEAAQAHAAARQEAENAREELQRVRDEAEKLRKAKDILSAEHNRAVLDAQEKVLALEKSVETLRTERDEVQQQNDQLHEHLEAVSRQVALLGSHAWDGKVEDAMQEADAADEANTTTDTPHGEVPAASAVPSKGELQVIRYLRREKEVRELERDMAVQERARVEQMLETTKQALESCRADLAQQRESSQSPSAQYTELLDKINQLSALREHVTTLGEAKLAVEARNQALEAQLKQAQTEVQPFREQLQRAQVELETSQSRLRVVQDDVTRWKTRASGLLQSSGVEEELKKVEKERAEAQQQVQAAKNELASETERLSTELQAANKRFEQLREQVRARITQERRAVAEAVERAKQLEKDMASQAQVADDEKKALQAKLDELSSAPIKTESDQQKDDAPATVPTNPTSSSEPNTTGTAASVETPQPVARADAHPDSTSNQEAPKQEEQAASGPAPATSTSETPAQETKDNANTPGKPEQESASQPAPTRQGESSTAPSSVGTPSLEQQLQAKVEECEKHKHFARTFLKEKRAAEAQLKTLSEQLASAQSESSNTPQKQESDTGEPATTSSLQARIAELEDLLSKAQAQVSELEKEVARIKDEGAKALAAKEEELKTLRAGPEAAISAKEAELQAHYQPLLQSRYEDGKREAALRNQIMISQRDKKITNLSNEINQLKSQLGLDPSIPKESTASNDPPKQETSKPALKQMGTDSSSNASKDTKKDSAKNTSTEADKDTSKTAPKDQTSTEKKEVIGNRPAVVRGGATSARGGRGGGAPKPVPIRTADVGVTSIRGAAASRGTAVRGRGGSTLAVAGGAKRKRELNASTSSENETKPPAAKPTSTKKSRAENKNPPDSNSS